MSTMVHWYAAYARYGRMVAYLGSQKSYMYIHTVASGELCWGACGVQGGYVRVYTLVRNLSQSYCVIDIIIMILLALSHN